MKRNLYLEIQNKESAKEYFFSQFQSYQLKTEILSTPDALGRTLSKPCYAKCSSPSFNSCAMDGIAVLSEKTSHANENHPIELVKEKDYVEVDTGDPLPKGFDAVIMAEDLIESEQGYKIISPTHPFAHVREVGEDIVATEMVLPSLHHIRPIDIAVLLSAGIHEVEVYQKVKVAIIPTGDEMIDWHEPLQKGKILETNSYMFENMITEYGGECIRYPILVDDEQKIEHTILDATHRADIVIINAGSSAGRDDYTSKVLNKIGEVFTHGVAIKPGKPVILSRVNQTPVIGLPGYPVSSYITFQEFVVGLMQQMMRVKIKETQVVEAICTKTILSSLKYEEYVRVKLGIVEGKLIASPLERGAGSLKSLVLADGFCVIPQKKEGILAHEKVNVRLMQPMDEIDHTLVVIGSHDLILDVINDQMVQSHEKLSSTHVGSFNGLLALRKKEAHLAPSHLLDEKTGIYNQSIVKELFSNEKMVIIKGVHRQQGLIVKKGNPKKIHGISDLQNNIAYINRQKGSGTRNLLDYLLSQNEIAPHQINGYDHEVTTHMAVAIAVSEDVDVGMGVYSASQALNLDFIECACEDYDFVTYASYLEHPMIQSFIQILKSKAFHDQLDRLGGYGYEESGEVIEL